MIGRRGLDMTAPIPGDDAESLGVPRPIISTRFAVKQDLSTSREQGPGGPTKDDVRRRAARILSPVAVGVSAIILAYVVAVGLFYPHGLLAGPYGGDYATYMTAAHDWLAGRGFYLDYQLVGPYVVTATERLYPPTILPFLVVFAFLPGILWWAIPAAIVIGVVVYWRPRMLAWAAILLCLAVPSTLEGWAVGNPGIWIAAAVAAGTRWGWPGVLVLLKPSLFPFAVVGIRTRGWWIAAGLLALVSLAFLPLWVDYATVLLNARGPRVSLLYSMAAVPMLLIPIIAWAGRCREATPREPA
jgi:hypothetical protein